MMPRYSCMAYVDLNPVRAGTAPDLRRSAHTSIQRRLRTHRPRLGQRPLASVAGSLPANLPQLSLDTYIALVDWTGRQLHPGKRGVIAAQAPPALRRVAREAEWLLQVRGIECRTGARWAVSTR